MTAPTPQNSGMTKERLAAFADGELSPEESAAVVMHLADHPQDQAYVDDLVASNAALRQAFSDPLDEPVPQALRDLILGPPPAPARVVPLRQRPALSGSAKVWSALGAAALAAGIAVAVVLPRVDPLDLAPGPLPGNSALHAALTRLPAGEAQMLAGGAEVMILGSVQTPDGYCREVEVMQPASAQMRAALACTAGGDWRIEVVIAEDLADAVQAEGFGTASGDEAQGFAPFLDRIGAGAFLTPAEESAAMAKGWAR